MPDESTREEEDPFASSGNDSQSVCLTANVLTFVESLHESDATSNVDAEDFGNYEEMECIDISDDELDIMQCRQFSSYAFSNMDIEDHLAVCGAMSPGCSRLRRLASATFASDFY